MNLRSDCLAEIEVALSEACTKVLHHAETVDAYKVAINIDGRQLTMDVIDLGVDFELRQRGQSVPVRTAEPQPGLALMQAFTDQTTVHSVSGNGWVVHLAKKLRWAPDAPVVPPQGQRRGISPNSARPENGWPRGPIANGS